VDALAEAGYRVVTFDRPGFGLADKADTFNYSVGNQAKLTAELMDSLAIETATIIGHSAGGNVAVHFAHQYPERTARLVLVDAAALAGGPPAFVGSLVSLPPLWRWGRVGLQFIFTRQNLENTLKGFYADSSFMTEADYDVYWRAFQTPGWDVALLGLTRDGAGSQLGQAAISEIMAETLVLWGAEDTTTPLSQGETLAQWIPNSRLVVLPGVGHQAFEEAPDAFNSALLEFLGPVE
jgi:pimeloyl-ACP methyl ester carboxylesterase